MCSQNVGKFPVAGLLENAHVYCDWSLRFDLSAWLVFLLAPFQAANMFVFRRGSS